jgi:hypothetical protein
MQKTKWLDNHELFYAELKKGIQFQKILAQSLQIQGIEVDSPILGKELDSEDCSKEEFDSWMESRKDIKASRKKFGLRDQDLLIGKSKILCECKSRDIKFIDVDSFPYADIFIDTVSGYEKKQDKPKYTFCISQKTNAIIFTETDPSQKDKWEKKYIFDKKRGIRELNYSAPKALWKNFSEFKYIFIDKIEN